MKKKTLLLDRSWAAEAAATVLSSSILDARAAMGTVDVLNSDDVDRYMATVRPKALAAF